MNQRRLGSGETALRIRDQVAQAVFLTPIVIPDSVPNDQISRIGGEEFCIIMPGTGQEMARSIVDKILRINEQLKDSGENLPPITISAGIAFWDRQNPKGDLLKDADTMLLKVKKQRTPCYAVYPGDHA